MPEIRPALEADREAVLRYLRAAHGGSRSHEVLFRYPWHRPAWNFGYLISDGGDIKGFLGHIYSERVVGDAVRRFANQTSWSVEPQFRRYSLDLFQASLAEPDVTVTNFSANDKARRILETYKFQVLDRDKVVVSPQHGTLARRTLEIAEIVEPGSLPDGERRRLVADHRVLGCRAFTIEGKGESGIVITLRRSYRGIPYADVLHSGVTPPTLKALGSYVVTRDCVVGLGIPRRWLGSGRFLAISNRRPTYYRSADLAPTVIDTLYSEIPLLYGAAARRP